MALIYCPEDDVTYVDRLVVYPGCSTVPSAGDNRCPTCSDNGGGAESRRGAGRERGYKRDAGGNKRAPCNGLCKQEKVKGGEGEEKTEGPVMNELDEPPVPMGYKFTWNIDKFPDKCWERRQEGEAPGAERRMKKKLYIRSESYDTYTYDGRRLVWFCEIRNDEGGLRFDLILARGLEDNEGIHVDFQCNLLDNHDKAVPWDGAPLLERKEKGGCQCCPPYSVTYYLRSRSSDDSYWSNPCLLSPKKLETSRDELMLDGVTLRICVTLILFPAIKCTVYNGDIRRNFGSGMLNNASLVDRKDCYDMTLAVNDQQIRCYKGFLIANSPVFRAMFQTDCVEGRDQRIVIEDTNPEAIKSFLEYLYTGFCSATRAYDLLHLAHKYQVDSLFMVAQCYLINDIDVDTVCRYLEWAYLHNASTLKQVAAVYLQSHISSLSDTEDFKKLSQRVLRDIITKPLKFVAVSPLVEDEDVPDDRSDFSGF